MARFPFTSILPMFQTSSQLSACRRDNFPLLRSNDPGKTHLVISNVKCAWPTHWTYIRQTISVPSKWLIWHLIIMCSPDFYQLIFLNHNFPIILHTTRSHNMFLFTSCLANPHSPSHLLYPSPHEALLVDRFILENRIPLPSRQNIKNCRSLH